MIDASNPLAAARRAANILDDRGRHDEARELRDGLNEMERLASAVTAGYEPLRWSSEPPTEPGWYWRRPPAGENGKTCCVEVRYGNEGSGNEEHLGYWTPFGAGRVDALPAEWAGPIPEPGS